MRLLGGGARTMFVGSGDHVIENLIAAMRVQYELGRASHNEFDARFSWDGWTAAILELLGREPIR